MDKSQNKLYKTGKKWVITAFAATTIGTSGYTQFNSNVAYADDGQTVTTNGNYVEMALNASKEAQSSSDIVSSISDKWQYCPGGDSLIELREQAINNAYSASSASFRLSRSQMDENEQSLVASTAISYADNASSIASIATVSASSISSVASSMASSAQYKLGIYKSYAASVNAKIHDLSVKVNELDKDGDIKNSPRLSSVDVLSHLTDDVSNADVMLSDVNSMADSTTANVIGNNNINSLYYAMISVSMNCANISMLSSSLSYSDVLYNASAAIQSKKDDDKFRQINNSLNSNAKNSSNKNISSSAFAFSYSLSAYDIARNLYSKMHGDNNFIYNSIDETPYRSDSYVLTNEFPKVEDAFYNISSNLKDSVDKNNQFYPSINSAFDAAKKTASMAVYVSSVFASQFPIDSVVAMESSNISMANSAYSAIDSLSRAVASPSEENNSVYKGIDSYIAVISSAADQTKYYADNVSSLNTKWGKNNSSLTSLSNQIDEYANLIRNELDKSKNLGHSQTLEQSSLSVSYASSLVSKASENNLTANSIANSISAATSANSDTHKNSNTSSSHLNNSSVPSSQNNSGYNPNNNFIYKIPTTSSNSGAPNHSSQTSSNNSSAEYYVPNSTTSSTTSQSASSASTSSSAATSSSATINSSSPITTSNNSDSTVYKKLYQKVQKNLTKEISINKSKVAKFKKAYQKTKNKRDKAKQLKAYQDAQYKLKLAQKHYRSINK